MNLLMTVAVFGAIGIGEWFEAATVAFLFALSLALESWSVGRARRAVAALMELTPPVARLKRPDGTEEQVPPEQVPVGAHFVVMPGEKFPLDGSVVGGFSEVNQASITGESLPVPKQPGDPVFAGDDQRGRCPGRGMHEARQRHDAGAYHPHGRRGPVATRPLGAMGREVRPRLHARGDGACRRFSGRAAALVRRSVGRLVLSVAGAPGDCLPLRLVISTPVSIVAALAAAARNGVLVKGGSYVEAPAGLQAIAFRQDGNADRRQASRLGGGASERARRKGIAGARCGDGVAQRSPLGPRHRRFCPGARSPHCPGRRFSDRAGQGGHGPLQRPALLARLPSLPRRKRPRDQGRSRRLEALSQGGRTVVVVGNDDHVCGFIALADAVRPEAKQAIEALRDAGLRHIVMLTGDNRGDGPGHCRRNRRRRSSCRAVAR